MYLVPSYVGTQIWGTASHHVLLLSSRKSWLMTSRGKLVHWWGSWEGAGGPGRAAAARRRRRRPPVRRPPAPPAGGAGDGGGSAGSARGDGPRRRRGAERRGEEPERGAPPPPPPPPPAAAAGTGGGGCGTGGAGGAGSPAPATGAPCVQRGLRFVPVGFSVRGLCTPVHKSYTIRPRMLATLMFLLFVCIYIYIYVSPPLFPCQRFREAPGSCRWEMAGTYER